MDLEELIALMTASMLSGIIAKGEDLTDEVVVSAIRASKVIWREVLRRKRED